jgi:ATP/maltotriose-dependent transcriptional regulator MalT
MHAADDSDGTEPRFVSDDTETILVGLAFSDRNLGLRIRSMISQMAAVEVVGVDDADVILTDITDAHTGRHLILQNRAAMDTTGGAVDKHAGIDVLQAAICLIAHGYRITVPRVERPPYSVSAFDDTTPHAGEPLTTREQQVLEKLAAGASNKMIARDLHISLATVKFHVGSLLAKLGARNRTDAVAIGLKLGILLL